MRAASAAEDTAGSGTAGLQLNRSYLPSCPKTSRVSLGTDGVKFPWQERHLLIFSPLWGYSLMLNSFTPVTSHSAAPSCPEAFTVHTVSTDTIFRFQEIPQHAPETDITQSQRKMQQLSSKQKKIFQSCKMPRANFTIPSSKHQQLYCHSQASKNQVSRQQVWVVSPANPLCHPAQSSAWAQAEATDLQVPTAVSDLPSSMPARLQPAG